MLFACEKHALTNSTILGAHPLATKAGLSMYEYCGNAFDADVTAGFTLAVVVPSMSDLGGRLQAIYVFPKDSKHHQYSLENSQTKLKTKDSPT
jgi:gamma-glutamyltranspeptidase